MTILETVLITVTAVLSLALVAFLATHGGRDRAIKGQFRHRVLVTLKSGAAFDGVLWEADRHAWLLRDASAVGAGDRGENVPVDGEVLILAADIEFAQRPQ